VKEVSLTEKEILGRFQQVHTISSAIGLEMTPEQAIGAVFKLSQSEKSKSI
jgi:hypothetical protein